MTFDKNQRSIRNHRSIKRSCIKYRMQIKTTKPRETVQAIFSWFNRVEREGGKINLIGLGLFGPLDMDPYPVDFGCIKTTKQDWKNINLVKILYEKFHPYMLNFANYILHKMESAHQ